MNKPTSNDKQRKAYDLYRTASYFRGPRGNLSNRAMRSKRAWKRMFTRAERRDGHVDLASALEEYRCVGCGSLDCEDFWCDTLTPGERAIREAEEQAYTDYMEASLYDSMDDYRECRVCGLVCEADVHEAEDYGDYPGPYDYGDYYD